jgi:anti-sigma factor RsiW
VNPVRRIAIADADVHAYVDGQPTSEPAARIESAIASDPELAARVAGMRASNALLRDALDQILAEPIPARLLAAAETSGSK